MLHFLRSGIQTAKCKPTMGIRRATEIGAGLCAIAPNCRTTIKSPSQKATGAEIFRFYAALRLNILPSRYIADLYPMG